MLKLAKSTYTNAYTKLQHIHSSLLHGAFSNLIKLMQGLFYDPILGLHQVLWPPEESGL
jgi:hypothetical protein